MATVQYPPSSGGDNVVVGTTEVVGSAVFSNSNNVSFGVATNGVVTASANVAAAPTMSLWVDYEAAANNANISAVSRPVFWPLNYRGPMPGAMSWDTLGLCLSGATNVTTAETHTLRVSLGLYQLSNATQLSMINSVGWTTGLAASASSYSNIYGGVRVLTLNSSAWSSRPTVSAGGSYWMGIMIVTSGTPPVNLALLGQRYDVNATNFSGAVGVMATDRPAMPWHGIYTNTTAALPTAVSFGEVIGGSAMSNQLNGLMPTIQAAQGVSWLT